MLISGWMLMISLFCRQFLVPIFLDVGNFRA